MAVTNYHTVGGRILGETTAGVRTDYLTDALGSVTATVNSAGAVVNRYRYKAYGALLSKSGAGADPSNQWVGSLGYRQTGKKYSDVYVRARHYDTSNGRWTSKDPIEFAGGDWNVYRYVGAQPTRAADPSGEVRWEIHPPCWNLSVKVRPCLTPGLCTADCASHYNTPVIDTWVDPIAPPCCCCHCGFPCDDERFNQPYQKIITNLPPRRDEVEPIAARRARKTGHVLGTYMGRDWGTECPQGCENTPDLSGPRGWHYMWHCKVPGRPESKSLVISVLCCKCFQSSFGPEVTICASTRDCHVGPR